MKKALSIVLCFVLALSCVFSAVVTANADTVPNYVAVVLDVSYTMDIGSPVSRLDSEKEAAINFCEKVLHTQGNKVCVIAFASGAEIVCDFTDDLDLLKTEINKIKTTGATYFSAALETANEALTAEEAKGVKFRRNIVLCSDGTPLGGKKLDDYAYTKDDYSYYYNANYALKYRDDELVSNTKIYTIGLFKGMSGSELDFAKRFMKDLSTEDSIIVDNGEDLVIAFDDTASNIVNVDTPDTPDPANNNTSSEDSSSSSSNSSSSGGSSSNSGNNNITASSGSAAAQSVASDSVSTGDSSVSFALVLTVSLAAFAVIALTARKRETE